MKKHIITILLLCMVFANIVKAEDSNLLAIDNIIYIAADSVEAGKTTTLSICMKNTAPIRGFQFNLYLPEGVTAVKNNKGRIQATLNAERLEEDNEHSLYVSEQRDGSLLFLCGSLYQENFIGNEGEVVTLNIRVSKGMAEGDSQVFIKNIKLTETDISKFYKSDEMLSILRIKRNTDIVPTLSLGDINGDGSISIADVTALVNIILNRDNKESDIYIYKAADVNEDGSINIADVTALVNIILGKDKF